MAGTYLLEVNLCLAVVILLYKVAFQGLTFFNANRLYLLFGMLFSIMAPALHIPLSTGQWKQPSEVAARLIPDYASAKSAIVHPQSMQDFNLSQILWIIYGCVAAWHLYKLFADVFAVVRLIRKYPSRKLGNARLLYVNDEIPASSFFNYIFMNQSMRDNNASLRTCIAHELVHCRQVHTADWLLARLLSALCWFNPLMRFWREAVTANHEFIADAHAANQAGRFRYTHLLVNLSSSTQISTLHYFSYYGQIKSRIIMLHQTPSRAINRLRFLAIVPLAALMLFLVSCETPAEQTGIINESNKDFIGIWENTSRTTMNENDGKTPRDFPERSGGIKVCLQKLVLRADGRFEMHDNTTSLAGTWQTNRAGDVIQLFCGDSKAGNDVISLSILGKENEDVVMWQSYPADGRLSAGHVFYEYKKL